jgi:hypothetical protein
MFPIIITQSDWENYLNKQHRHELKVIIAVIKGFKEMEGGA